MPYTSFCARPALAFMTACSRGNKNYYMDLKSFIRSTYVAVNRTKREGGWGANKKGCKGCLRRSGHFVVVLGNVSFVTLSYVRHSKVLDKNTSLSGVFRFKDNLLA